MEKILKIEDTSFGKDKYSSYDGYVITTDKQQVKVGISNGQSCCEQWGYLTSEDNLEEFIGADLLDIKDLKEVIKQYRELNG